MTYKYEHVQSRKSNATSAHQKILKIAKILSNILSCQLYAYFIYLKWGNWDIDYTKKRTFFAVNLQTVLHLMIRFKKKTPVNCQSPQESCSR